MGLPVYEATPVIEAAVRAEVPAGCEAFGPNFSTGIDLRLASR